MCVIFFFFIHLFFFCWKGECSVYDFEHLICHYLMFFFFIYRFHCCFFFGTPAKENGTQERAHMHTGKQPTQVGRKPTHAGRKPTHAEKEPAQAGRGDVPGVQTPGSQVRTDAPYPFLTLTNVE